MKKFAYLYADDPTIPQLNILGEDGWELVAVLDKKNLSMGISRFVFKREITR